MSKETKYRIEHDSIGEKQMPKGAYYGVRTLCTAENFFITGPRMHSEFTNGFAQVKKVVAITNFEVGRLGKERISTVIQACDEIMSGRLHDEFIVDPIQGGAGTSLNMNANETIVNWAIEILREEKGDYPVVSPDDHINYGQPTNDVSLSCGRLTTLRLLHKAQAELERLYHMLMEKSEEFNHVIKMGRTQLQDAVPIRLGQEFHAYVTAIYGDINRFDRAKEEVRCLNLDGTVTGTGLDTGVEYLQRVVKNISLISGLELIRIYDLIDATQNPNGHVVYSGIARSCVVNLSKMCNDLRPILSGPRTRLRKINLPAKQNGFSIMPGKANLVILEVVNQAAFHVIGNDMTIAMTTEVGQLELDVFEPIIFYKLFQSVETTACAARMLVDSYISGITVNEQHCKDMVENGVGIITTTCPYVGYEKTANAAKGVIRTGRSIRELIIRDKLLTEEQLDIILNPVSMTEPGISGIEAVNKMGGL